MVCKFLRHRVDFKGGTESLEPRLFLTMLGFSTRTVQFIQHTPFTVSAPDLSGDGLPDILMVLKGRDQIVWYESTGSLDGFARRDVGRGDDVFAAHAVDLDGDSDLDIVTGSEEGKIVAWFENDRGLFYGEDPNDTLSDGKGLLWMVDASDGNSFVMRHGTAVAVGDVDGDGAADIVAAYDVDDGYGYSEIAWFRNLGGGNGFAPPMAIARSTGPIMPKTESLVLADLDLDGDIDLVTGSTNTNRVEWFENVDGSWQVFELHLIGGGWDELSSVLAVDLDQDGDLDIAAASRGGGEVAWYENTDGRANFSERVVLVSDAIRPESIDFKDISGDGSLDLLISEGRDRDSATTFSQAGRIVWYEGRNDPLSFHARSLVVAQSILSASVFAVDLDQDGDLDVLAGATYDRDANLDGIVVFEQRMIGDVDRNGRFDTSDLIEVFSNGQYEDGLLRNSSFDEGDWNGDDEFTSSDLVLALQTGHYESSIAMPLDRALVNDVAFAVASQTQRTKSSRS